MYVCLCKALTESDVSRKARGCFAEGECSVGEVLQALGLRGDEACGYCAANPEHILAILEDEIDFTRGYSAPDQVRARNT